MSRRPAPILTRSVSQRRRTALPLGRALAASLYTLERRFRQQAAALSVLGDDIADPMATSSIESEGGCLASPRPAPLDGRPAVACRKENRSYRVSRDWTVAPRDLLGERRWVTSPASGPASITEEGAEEIPGHSSKQPPRTRRPRRRGASGSTPTRSGVRPPIGQRRGAGSLRRP